MSIGVGYSSVVPNTRQEAGIPENANSGILANFNNNFMNNPIPGELMRTMVVGTESVGVSYVVDWRNIFQPKNQGGGQNFNNYLPWPDFSQSFAYDSSASMLIEYRMDPNLSSGVALTNGFAFHAGIISSMMPRFRVYIRGGAYVNDSSGTPQYIQPDVWGASAPTSFPNAANHLAKPGLYGDNSRYLMVFEYVKRLSRVQSPFLGYKAPVGYDVYFLNPIIEPPVEDAPFGTKLTMRFRSTPNPDSVASYSPWVNPDEVESVLDEQPFNDQDYLRFEAVFEANVEQGIVPTIDTVSIPFLIELK
jgi:hypothetical protein